MTVPRSGPCSPWVSGPAVLALPWVTKAAAKAVTEQGLSSDDVDVICAQAAVAASEVLYELSGRTFTGECGPETVRPIARPTDIDTRSWVSGTGWFSSWGSCASSYGTANPGVASHYGCSNPPEIELGAYPVSEIIQVLIDGVLIPSDEYELRDFRTLVRMRPSENFSPTQRWGWPTCQINDLPDTEQGTFSVTYTYGQPAPAMGQSAAVKLAECLALPQLGDSTRYPKRTTQIARQGVTAQVASAIDVLAKGSLGIWEVDVFILAVNPKKLQRRASVFSPDVGRPRRTATPSLPS